MANSGAIAGDRHRLTWEILMFWVGTPHASPERMPSSDRALRLVFREQPDALRRLALAGLGASGLDCKLMPESFDDPKLDLPAPIEADFVARQPDGSVLHVEMQGYRDPAFVTRLFRYHLALVARHPDRPVQTVAIWLVRPPPSQRADCIEISNVRVRVDTIVLPEIPSSTLLADPVLACLAPAADPEGRTSAELCRLVARALRVNGATWAQRNMAAVAAAMHGRYHHMVQAMKAEELEPIIIEDLVYFGEDRGYERGMREGVERGMREGTAVIASAILDALAFRGVELGEAQRSRIEAETDPGRLRDWLRAVIEGRPIEV